VKSKERREFEKKSHFWIFYILVVLGLHVVYMLINTLWIVYLIAVGVYYLLAASKHRVNKEKIKNRHELSAKAIMPWLNGFVFAIGAIGIMYGFLSSNARVVWMQGFVVGVDIINTSLYLFSYFTVVGLLWAFQHRMSRDDEQEECKEHVEKHEGKRGYGRY